MRWYAYGRMPNGVSLCVPATVYKDDDRLLAPGYWDLSEVRRYWLIRHPDLTDPTTTDTTPHTATRQLYLI